MTHTDGRDDRGKVGIVELADFSSCRGLVTRSFVTVNSYMSLFDGISDRDIPDPHRDSHLISKNFAINRIRPYYHCPEETLLKNIY